MKIVVDRDEKWPIYFIKEQNKEKNILNDRSIEIPRYLYFQYLEIQQKYNELQKCLQKIYFSNSSSD